MQVFICEKSPYQICVTQVYLASFGNKDIDKANENVIGCII